jgi:hypothetical protein
MEKNYIMSIPSFALGTRTIKLKDYVMGGTCRAGMRNITKI